MAEQLKDLAFFCWQLGEDRVNEIANGCKTLKCLLKKLSYEFNIKGVM